MLDHSISTVDLEKSKNPQAINTEHSRDSFAPNRDSPLTDMNKAKVHFVQNPARQVFYENFSGKVVPQY